MVMRWRCGRVAHHRNSDPNAQSHQASPAMTQADLPFFLEPQWSVPALLALLLASAAVMSRIAGWATIAAAYPEQADPQGDTLRFISGELGSDHFPIRYRNCLRLRISPRGLGVALMFPFNFRSPAFFVAWQDVDGLEERQLLATRAVVIRFRGQAKSLTLHGAIAQHVLSAYRTARPELAG
jgi:hypothetical protein